MVRARILTKVRKAKLSHLFHTKRKLCEGTSVRNSLGEVAFSLSIWKVMSSHHSLTHCFAHCFFSGQGRELCLFQGFVGI